MRPLDRVAQDHDELGVWDEGPDALLGIGAVQVERRRLAAERAARRIGEQRLVFGPAPDVLPVGLHVTRPAAAAGRRPLAEEELRLFDPRHEQARMRGQGRVQGCGTGLRGTSDEEIRQGHGGDLLGGAGEPAKTTIPTCLVD
jgi:hypothetical protein